MTMQQEHKHDATAFGVLTPEQLCRMQENTRSMMQQKEQTMQRQPQATFERAPITRRLEAQGTLAEVLALITALDTSGAWKKEEQFKLILLGRGQSTTTPWELGDE